MKAPNLRKLPFLLLSVFLALPGISQAPGEITLTIYGTSQGREGFDHSWAFLVNGNALEESSS